jgi:hypothetical protein
MANSITKPGDTSEALRTGRFRYWSCGLARGVLVLAMLTYGTAKFAGAQFFASGGILDRPVADLSGIELTWVFFGHSWLYSCFVASGQLFAAALLMFGKTARLGAVCLLPITANIVVVNFGYRIGLDTQIVSSILLALNLYLLAWDLPTWKRVFWEDAVQVQRPPRLMNRRSCVALQAVIFFFTAGALFWFLARENAVGRSPIAGDWLIASAKVDGQRTTDPALGADWRWVSFDMFGRLSVRTNQFTLLGRYTADENEGKFTIRYALEPLAPIFPGQSMTDYLSPEQVQRILDQNDPNYRWPVELTGTYRAENNRLVITLPRDSGKVEWVLTPFERPRF